MSVGSQAAYATVRMGLRPARLAIVFDGGTGWHYWARLALHAATQIWGGSDFLLIPHRDGQLLPALLEAVTVYDPDHVALLQRTAGQHELNSLGSVPFVVAGRQLAGQDRQDWIGQAADIVIEDPAGAQARDAVSAACSPHRHRTSKGQWIEDVTVLRPGATSTGLTLRSDVAAAPGGSCLSAPPNWGAAAGVAVAARCGALAEPRPGQAPPLDTDQYCGLLRWLLRTDREGTPPEEVVWHPGAAASVIPASLETAFQHTEYGLVRVRRGSGREQPVLVVAGDDAADFALALAWERLYGHSLWLPMDCGLTWTRSPRT